MREVHTRLALRLLLDVLDILDSNRHDEVALTIDERSIEVFAVGDTIEGVDLTIGELGTLSDGLLEIFIPSEGDAMELSGEELAPISQ